MKGKPSAVFYRNVKVVLSALQVQCSLICCYLAELLISSHKVFFIGHNNFMLAIRCFTYSTTQTHSLSDIFAALTEKVHKHFSQTTVHLIEFIDTFCKRYMEGPCHVIWSQQNRTCLILCADDSYYCCCDLPLSNLLVVGLRDWWNSVPLSSLSRFLFSPRAPGPSQCLISSPYFPIYGEGRLCGLLTMAVLNLGQD